MNKNRVLGKGLSALIQGADLRAVAGMDGTTELLQRVPLDAIGFNPDQPRKFFDDGTLGELADSIKQVGGLQPVLLRRLNPGEKAAVHPDSPGAPQDLTFGVVAGERRVRAARLAKLKDIPAIICGFAETEALKVALLEKIQREDLAGSSSPGSATPAGCPSGNVNCGSSRGAPSRPAPPPARARPAGRRRTPPSGPFRKGPSRSTGRRSRSISKPTARGPSASGSIRILT